MSLHASNNTSTSNNTHTTNRHKRWNLGDIRNLDQLPQEWEPLKKQFNSLLSRLTLEQMNTNENFRNVLTEIRCKNYKQAWFYMEKTHRDIDEIVNSKKNKTHHDPLLSAIETKHNLISYHEIIKQKQLQLFSLLAQTWQ